MVGGLLPLPWVHVMVAAWASAAASSCGAAGWQLPLHVSPEEQEKHKTPPAPHALTLVPAWQTSFASQHPEHVWLHGRGGVGEPCSPQTPAVEHPQAPPVVLPGTPGVMSVPVQHLGLPEGQAFEHWLTVQRAAGAASGAASGALGV